MASPIAKSFSLHDGFILAASLTLCLFATYVSEAVAEDEKARRVGILMEGTFESPDISRHPEGAKATLMVPSAEWEYGVRAFSEELWKERGFTWERILAISTTVADQLAESVEPDIVRDGNGVVEYVILEDKDPFLTSILLSSKLRERFRDTLGDRIFAVCVDRHAVYLFPATGGKLEGYGPGLVDQFSRTSFPVSLEVFLVDKDGFRVVGHLERGVEIE